VEQLKNASAENYTVSTNWKGALYCGIYLDWDYEQRTVQLTIPNYIQQALHNFQHNTPTWPQNAPYPWRAPTFGTKTQLTPPPNKTPLSEKKQITRTQQVLGTLLYWERTVNPMIIPAISALASEQETAT
jgi:hypothetical protein